MAIKSRFKFPLPIQFSSSPFDKPITLFGRTLAWPQAVVGFILLVTLLYILRGTIVAALVNGTPIARLTVVKELEKQAGTQVLDTLISEALIKQEAARRGVSITQAEVEAQFAKINKQLKAQGQSIDSVLAAQGLTKSDVEKQLRVQIMVEKLVADKTKATDKEIEAYIQENKEFFDTLKEGEKRSQAEEQVRSQKVNQVAGELVQKLRKQARITRLVDF